MKLSFAALLCATMFGSAASAVPLHQEQEDVWSLSAPIVLVQQISVPIVINQAVAIGILSQGVTAYAEANVVSANFATIAIGGSGGTTTFLNEEIAGLDGSLEELVASALDLALAENFESNLLNVLLALDGLTALLELDLDDIRNHLPDGGGGVTAVPVPAALPLVGAAFGGLGLYGWSRRRKADA